MAARCCHIVQVVREITIEVIDNLMERQAERAGVPANVMFPIGVRQLRQPQLDAAPLAA